MRLKTLEIKGFKSFADETVIHFNQSVIGIVGPNGSGKSNIVDAIRWVLGEQSSKELRLDHMASVIFNGTKKRKPSPLATVTLTFENTKNVLHTEYSTVSINRLLYQSGDSEYRLNNVPCRLKDITSLFLDTGIGADSYAIIALGMVDDILNDKENSRLRMLEQAAGVSKYKTRKRETLNKLKITDGDLERVEDLLFEIENNLKTLEQQAKKTKRFFEIKNEYKEWSLRLSQHKLANLKVRQQDLKAQIEKEEDAFRQTEVETARLEALLEQERKSNLDKEKDLSERQRDLNNLVADIRNAENERNLHQQRQEFIVQNKGKLLAQIQLLTARTAELTEQIESYRTELAGENKAETELEVQLKNAESQVQSIRQNHGSIKADLDDILKGQQAFERELFELEKQKAVNQNRIENLRYELESIENTAFQRKLELDNIEAKIKEISKKELAQQKEVDALVKAAEKRKASLADLEQKSESIQTKITAANRELDARRNEFKLTQSMVESLEGYPESIKFLNANREWSAQAPLLSDLIYVKEDYRIAIENYLDPYLNFYVVNNRNEAFKAIRMLNQSQKGKANFFLLDAFKEYEVPMGMMPGTPRALDFVETDPQYRKLMAYLLENVLITENDDPNKTPDQTEFTILSKGGHFIKKRYSVSGGSVGLFEGKKIGRKKNLEILDHAIKRLEGQAAELNEIRADYKSKIEALRAVNDDRLVGTAREELQKTIQEKITTQSRCENLEHLLAELSEKKGKLTKESEHLAQSNEEIESALQDKTGQLLEVKSRIAKVDSSYREIADQLSQASSFFNEKNIAFIRQQNKVNTLQKDLAYREHQLEDIRQKLESDQQTLTDSDSEMSALASKLSELEELLKAAYEDRRSKESLLTEAEQVYFSGRGGINEIEEQLRKQGKQRNDYILLINTMKDKLGDVRLEISSLSERVRVEFHLQLAELPEPENPLNLEEEAELQLKVERLRNRLDNYGEINPMAVEAFDTMKERYDLIVQQRDDIRKAKIDLMATIEEIEMTATAQFLDAFAKVRLFFINVFRSLFSEDDDADLILLDPENPLDSKIEIVAKPKGKRPQTISQLSGGEKTLTATALLFSLYLLKPAPFCIFDEVDAPLDDTNIEKFNRIIKKFSRDSQFIIVTHNKLTMAAVDVIYGVYMQEQGISAVTPVDFRTYDHRTVLETVA